MKKLFMAIFIPVMVILGTPALIATIMYDGSGDANMPIHLYTEDADAEAMIYQELADSFDELDAGITEDMIYNLNEDIINVAIFQAFREQNPDYMPTEDCNTPEACYVVFQPIPVEGFDISLRVVGAWVNFEQDKFVLNLFLEVELQEGIVYKTVIQTHFKFTDLPGKYVLQFEKINIGNLPLPASMISSIMTAIDDNVDSFSFDDFTSEVPIGELDITDFTYTLEKEDILAEIAATNDGEEPDTGNKLVGEVLGIIFDQELVSFELKEAEFVLSARLSKFTTEDETDIPEYLYDLHYTSVVDDVTVVGEFNPDALDPESYLTDLFTEYVFNYALVNDGFRITEETFNKLIYAGASGFAETRTVKEYPVGDGETREIEIGLKAMWFEFEADKLYAKALIRVGNVNSVLRIRADVVTEASTDTDIVLEFTSIDFGYDADETLNDYLSISDLTVFEELLMGLDDVKFATFEQDEVTGQVTMSISAAALTATMGEGSQDGTVVINSINLAEGAILLDIEPADTDLALVLQNFSTALNGVVESADLITDLEAVLDTTTAGPEQDVFNAVQDLQDTLAAEETVTPEQVETLFDNFELMDPEAQEAFLTTFEDLMNELYPGTFDDFDTDFGTQSDEIIE